MSDFLDERLPDRFWSKCMPEPMSGCWLWFGASVHGGYGQIAAPGLHPSISAKVCYAYKAAYLVLVGDVPNGLHLDHLCRNRSCVNPYHLEPVTCGENVLRGDGPCARNLRKTHCPKGHPYDRVRKDGWRECRICLQERRVFDRRRRGIKPRQFKTRREAVHQ